MTPVAKTRAILLLVGGSVVLVFLHALGVTAGAETWLMGRLAGAEKRLSAAGRSVSGLLSSPARFGELAGENDALRKERDELLVEIARLRKAGEENAELRALLDFAERERQTPVAAHVIARTPQSGRHTVLLDKGEEHGLAVDMPVIVGNGILVGKIFRVERTTSLALLLTDTRSHVGASVQNAGSTLGVVQGKRGLSLEMRLIPQNQEIGPGDIVVTSGIEPLVPKGLVIGRVREVETEERSPFKRAVLESPADLERMEVVAVLFPG